MNSYDSNLLERWRLIFEPGRYLSEDSGYVMGKAFGYKHRYGAQVIQTNLGINWVPSIHDWHHSLTLLVNSVEDLIENEQVLVGFNCFENDCLYPKGCHGLKEGQGFLIRGCGAYDMQIANEWTRRKPPVYVWLRGNILTARMTSPGLLRPPEISETVIKIV